MSFNQNYLLQTKERYINYIENNTVKIKQTNKNHHIYVALRFSPQHNFLVLKEGDEFPGQFIDKML